MRSPASQWKPLVLFRFMLLGFAVGTCDLAAQAKKAGPASAPAGLKEGNVMDAQPMSAEEQQKRFRPIGP